MCRVLIVQLQLKSTHVPSHVYWHWMYALQLTVYAASSSWQVPFDPAALQVVPAKLWAIWTVFWKQ
jgi:hypothetical protein